MSARSLARLGGSFKMFYKMINILVLIDKNYEDVTVKRIYYFIKTYFKSTKLFVKTTCFSRLQYFYRIYPISVSALHGIII